MAVFYEHIQKKMNALDNHLLIVKLLQIYQMSVPHCDSPGPHPDFKHPGPPLYLPTDYIIHLEQARIFLDCPV